MQPARQVDSRATKAFEGVTVTGKGDSYELPLSAQEHVLAPKSQKLPLECEKCTGIQALTTGEKALSHHLLTRTALAQHQARRVDRRRHINALEEKISFPSNTLETRTAISR